MVFGRIGVVGVCGESGFGGRGEAEDGDRGESAVAVGTLDVTQDVAERREREAFGVGQERH